jgi:hypothetical protein
MFSIVCVYNDERLLNRYLLKSLTDQTANYELILEDNTKSRFSSAANALNRGGKSARGEYLMFVHQDVRLPSKDWLEVAESRLTHLPNLGAAGVAGMQESTGKIMTNLEQGDPPRLAGPIQITRPERAQTLDECLVLIPRSVFHDLEFDEDACDDWHLYVVDYCLGVKRLGYEVYVIPDHVYHRSPGDSMSRGYYRVMKKVMKKHSADYPVICTTMGNWITSRSVNMNRMIHLRRKLISYCLCSIDRLIKLYCTR